MSRIDEAYQTLLHDNSSGSSDILKRTIKWLKEGLSKRKQTEALSSQLKALCEAHPAMALLHNLGNFVQGHSLSVETIDTWMLRYQQHEQTACREFASHLEYFTNVLVHSYSGLLLQALQSVSGTMNVYCTESRPAFEGRMFAEKLAATQHKIYLVCDMASFSVLQRVEIVAFGCDSITSRGIVNKIGTAPLAKFAMESGKRSYFVGTTEKIIDTWNDDFLLREGSIDEIYRGKEPVQVENYYFDLTPPEDIGGLFLETGLSRIFDDATTSVSRR